MREQLTRELEIGAMRVHVARCLRSVTSAGGSGVALGVHDAYDPLLETEEEGQAHEEDPEGEDEGSREIEMEEIRRVDREIESKVCLRCLSRCIEFAGDVRGPLLDARCFDLAKQHATWHAACPLV